MPLRSRLLVVHNARSGRQDRQFYGEVLDRLSDLGCRVNVIETAIAGDGAVTAAAAASMGQYDAIIAAGGDGTVHDVAAGLLGTGVPLGIIPSGTANVLFRALDLPRQADALALLLSSGPEKQIPVGDANGQPVLFVLGVGLDAVAVRRFETGSTRKFGQLGLIWPVFGALATQRHCPRLRLSTKNGQADAAWIIATRSSRYAAGLMLSPQANIEQPTFHILRMAGGVCMRVLQLVAMSVGQLRHAPGVTVEESPWLTIASDVVTTAVQIDGEVATGLPLHLQIHPQRLTVIAPTE